jgi:hypothetical protein
MKNTMKTLMLTAMLLLAGAATAQVVETTTYDDGRVYTGQRDGKGRINGKGLMTFPNGDSYDGMWKKGEFDGEGTYVFATQGYTYSGQWKKGNIKGHGTFRFNNGNVLEGDWTAMGTGTGYLIFADGTRYDGPFVNGAPQGKGIKVWANGARYEGDFVQGHMSGQGAYSSANGETYNGTWVNDRRQGYGVCTYTDGAHYEGNWFNDRFHGQGTYTDAHGEVLSGNWINGDFQE